jgi:hypothetical protein
MKSRAAACYIVFSIIVLAFGPRTTNRSLSDATRSGRPRAPASGRPGGAIPLPGCGQMVNSGGLASGGELVSLAGPSPPCQVPVSASAGILDRLLEQGGFDLDGRGRGVAEGLESIDHLPYQVLAGEPNEILAVF